MTNGSKYLAHVIAKGVKGHYEPIINWYQELYAYTDHIISLLLSGHANTVMPFILNSFKPGLVSKNFEVALWASQLLTKISFLIVQNKEKKLL